jgi:hypothetical protein
MSAIFPQGFDRILVSRRGANVAAMRKFSKLCPANIDHQAAVNRSELAD